MTKSNQKPSVQKSCTAAARAAEAHAQQASIAEEAALNAANAANLSAMRAASTVERLAASHAYLTIITGASLIIACVSLALSIYLLNA